MNLPNYFNPQHFAQGQKVKYGEHDAVIAQHYSGGMWDIRLKSGMTCVSGADLKPADTAPNPTVG